MIFLELKSKPNSFKEVLDILYNNGRSRYTLVPTFFDEECTSIQCHSSTRRSLQDLFEIARTYFPDISLEEVYETISNKELLFYVCCTIKKVVFHYAGTYNATNYTLYTLREVVKDSCIKKELEDFIKENS